MSGPSRLYLLTNVWEEGLKRFRWLFDEFDDICVNISGGKDSDVVYHLAMMVAEEKGRLPLDVMWIDQEAEWDATVRHCRELLNDPRVRPHWLQVPFREFNATSPWDPWLHAWDPAREADWMREKEPNSYHDNIFGEDRFSALFDGFVRYTWPKGHLAQIAGVRAEESPGRRKGLTIHNTYKGATWGYQSPDPRGYYIFYPLYDWTYSDIWKAIFSNGWSYNEMYDRYYQYGISPMRMRISNLHHEQAVTSLYIMQEMEPETHEKLTKRLSGANTFNILGEAGMKPTKLPFMFRSWVEYRDHLLDNLIIDEDNRRTFKADFARWDAKYQHDEKVFDLLVQTEIDAILVNDYHGTKLGTFGAAHSAAAKGHGARGRKKYGRKKVKDA